MRWAWLALLTAACGGAPSFADGGVRVDGQAHDAVVFEVCGSYCLRPGDCQIAYPDDTFCPAGFRCATRFLCATDGASRD